MADLTRAGWWDLWYGVTFTHDDVPLHDQLVHVWWVQDGERVSVDVPWAEAEAEMSRRHLVNHERALSEIRSTPTRLLLKWLDLTRRFGGWYSPCQKSERHYGFHADDIRAELATREHVPNKTEARERRRSAALMHSEQRIPGSRATGA